LGTHAKSFGSADPRRRASPPRLDVELAHEASELLRAIAGLGAHRRTALTLRVAGYSDREIQQLLGVTCTWVNRHVTEGRQALRRAEDTAEAGVDEAVPKAA
jgi:DNA-directed RNA polymerase specialized sigma24 family protein